MQFKQRNLNLVRLLVPGYGYVRGREGGATQRALDNLSPLRPHL